MLDYLLKNNKNVMSFSHSNIEELFLLVYRDSKLKKNYENINNLKLIWKTWTYIF